MTPPPPRTLGLNGALWTYSLVLFKAILEIENKDFGGIIAGRYLKYMHIGGIFEKYVRCRKFFFNVTCSQKHVTFLAPVHYLLGDLCQ